MPHHAHGSTHAPYQTYYDARTFARIWPDVREDALLFNYSFDDYRKPIEAPRPGSH